MLGMSAGEEGFLWGYIFAMIVTAILDYLNRKP